MKKRGRRLAETESQSGETVDQRGREEGVKFTICGGSVNQGGVATLEFEK